MAKEFPDNKTLEVYQQGGGTESVNTCPEATSDDMVNIDNRERSIARSNYSKANTESKCGSCIFFDISSRIKKCANTKSDNEGYCWDQEFVCGSENVCDMWEEGGPITSNKDSYAQDESYNEFEQNKEEVEQIQTEKQMPVFDESQQQPMAPQQGAPPQAMPPQQQAPAPQEQIQPSFAYGGSLRKAQHESIDGIDYTIDPATGLPFDKTPAESMANRTIRLEAEAEEKRLAGLDNNTDVYDEANPTEAGSTLKSKYKDWRTKRAIKKYQKSLTPKDPFIMYNSDPSQGVIGEIGNWMKSVKKDFTTNWDHDNKKSNYQQFKVTNPHDDVRFFNKEDPDELITYGEKTSRDYNNFSNQKRATYPELYQESSMDFDGNITYKGDKLLGDMVETEYMPDAVSFEYNEDGTGITGGNVYTGTDDNGVKQYKFVPFDKENPTQISVGPNGQQRAQQELADKNICINAGGVWNAGVCTYPDETTKKKNLQKKKNEDFKKTPLNIDFDADTQLGGTPTFAHMRDGGSLSKYQSKSETEWTDVQLKKYLELQEQMLMSGGVDPSLIDVADKSTWPNISHSIADGTYNQFYPWLPDMTTAEGKSQMYNLHRTASEKFPENASMPTLYWGSDKDGNAYPYENESRTEKGVRTGTMMNKHLTEFNDKIKNVKSKTELTALVSEFGSTLDGNSLQYILNEANKNNDIDISNKDFIDVLQNIETFRVDNADEYENITYGPGDKVQDHGITEWGDVTLNKDYTYNPNTYADFTMLNPNAQWNKGNSKEGAGENNPAWNTALWNLDNFFRDEKITENQDGQKLTQPTQVWDENANNGEGGYISIKGGTFTNKTNQGTVNEKLHIGNLLKEKGIIPEGATKKEADDIIEKFTGGLGSKVNNYIDKTFEGTVPLDWSNGDPDRKQNPDLVDFTNTFFNPTFQEFSNSNPNQTITSKADALKSITLNSNQYGQGKLPSEIYGNATGTYNPHVKGAYYVDETTGENVWVDNPEYDSKFSTGVRGDFENGFTQNHETGWDYLTDSPISSTLGHLMQNQDVQWAMNNPGAAFGPLAMEAGPLLRGAGMLANYTKIAPLMNTGLFGTNVSAMNAINTGFGIDMASQIPGNIENKNYGMGLINSLAGLGTASNLAGRFNKSANLYPNLGKPSNVSIVNPTKGQAQWNLNNQLSNYTTNMRTLPFTKQIKPFIKDFKTLKNFNLKQTPAPSLIRKFGGGLFKAQMSNGAQDVADMYQVNPEQFDYDTNMPKEGAISSYGDVWQGGQWVDATVEEQGFNTPDSEQFGTVQNAFSDQTGVTNRNTGDLYTGSSINRNMKSAASDTYDVRRGDIDMNTFKPKDGSINKSYGDVYNSESDMFADRTNVTPSWDQTDDFAFKGDDNTLSRGQLRDVRKNNRRQNKAEENGFGSYDEMQIDKGERKAEKRQRKKDKRDRWGNTIGERLGNKINYALDSDLSQAWQKGSKAAVEGSKIINNIYDDVNANKEQQALLSTRSADDMYGVTSADALSRGEHDENTGIFQPDDKVISRWGKYGIELPRAQSQMETASIYDIPNKDGSYDDQNWFTKANHGFSEGVYNDAQRTNHGVAPIVGGGIIGKIADAKSIYDFGKEAYDGVSNWMNEGEVDEIAGTPEGYTMDMAKYGGHLKAQNQKETKTEFKSCAPIVDSGGRVFAQCQNRDFDSEHSATIGMDMTLGKQGNKFTGSFKGTGGYEFNPSGGTGGFKGYIGGKYGARANELEDNGASLTPEADASLYAGYTGEMGGNSYNWQNPLQYGFGAYGNKSLLGNQGNTVGAYANLGALNFKAARNLTHGNNEFSIGIGKYFKKGGEKQKTVNVNSDMYYELIAAGADIEII